MGDDDCEMGVEIRVDEQAVVAENAFGVFFPLDEDTFPQTQIPLLDKHKEEPFKVGFVKKKNSIVVLHGALDGIDSEAIMLHFIQEGDDSFYVTGYFNFGRELEGYDAVEGRLSSIGSHRTKEDDVAQISTSIYITNFPETCSAKDLFNTCKQYGHVVDAFIPSKRSKFGNRFGFVRFINVFNVERLVCNLCTVWIDRFKLRANITRFQRPHVNVKNHVLKSTGGGKNYNISANVSDNIYKNDQRTTGVGKTYMHAVKGISQHGSRENEVHALVLDDDCLLSKDFSKCLLGRVKEFASLADLKMTLNNEGFMDIKIQYMGEMRVMLEFGTEKSMKLFKDNVSVGSWFSQINQASMDFVTEGRIAWVELKDIDDQVETCFHSKRLCIHTKSHRSISEEFKIIFRGKVFWIRAKETPGWVPDFLEDAKDEDQSDVDSKDGRSKVHESGSCEESDGEGVLETLFDEDGLMKNQSEEENMDKHDDISEDPFHIYSLLKKKDKVVSNKDSKFSMKYPPGFTPNEGSDRASMHVEEGRGGNSENGNEGNVDVDNAVPSGNHSGMNLKEGGTESVCSGHFKKSEVPHTGGSILSLLDDVVKVRQVMGYKMDGCMSNMAEIIESQGVDEQNGKDFLIIVVYAPHDIKEKMMLCDYLTREIGRWKGEVVVMGDFNEVRNRSDRFGLVFNVQGANVFNSFISGAGLVEVPLGGCSFMWCHKSATKMSKLDRFLMFESLLNTCPNISAITLERYLSDHRPILLREY
nr:nucleotide-binding alpha-beta plait domain-containing protein [Tanacetum cinerariifolium]